jgi:tyrosyl-tRNA synthetase
VDLVVRAELASSNGEARRLLAQRGIARNGVALDAADLTDRSHLLAGRYVWLRRGKKTDALLTVDG